MYDSGIKLIKNLKNSLKVNYRTKKTKKDFSFKNNLRFKINIKNINF